MVFVDKQGFLRLLRLVKPFFFSEVKWHARGLFLLLVIFCFSIAGINFLQSYVYRDFMTAVSLKEHDEFIKKLILYLVILACISPVTVFQSYTEQRLVLLWRKWLSRKILQKYFNKLAYYKIIAYEGIDNPDQRLEEDIRSFTSTCLSLFIIFCNAILTLILFIHILWTISISLIVAVFVYAICGSLLAYLIGKPLIGLNFAQLKKEADYRYKLVNIRDHAESIGLYRGDKKELTRARQRLKKALSNSLRIINVNRNLNFFITLYNNFKPVIPIVIVAPLYFSGQKEFGVITQAADAFVRVVEALSILITNFGTVSGVIAVVSRLGSFTEALDEVTSESVKGGIEIESGEKIKFSDVTIYTPKGTLLLVKDLNFEITKGGLLITGGSGNGKTSILRVLAGLWDNGSGKIIRPNLRDSIYIPQRSYLVLGTLRNQLLYSIPNAGSVSNNDMITVLKQVGLKNILERAGGLDKVANWNSLLSAGEQQQLAFARLLLARPKFAFLDEATTAVDQETEEKLYSIIERTMTAFISIGYPLRIAKFHQQTIELLEDGQWSFRS